MKEFVKVNGVGDGELFLIAHSCTLRTFTTTEFDEKYLPVPGKCKQFKNAEIIEYELEI